MQMKPIVLFILISLFSLPVFCQSSILSVVEQREVLTPYYEMISAGSKVLYLPMDFGRSAFTYDQEDALRNLQNAEVVRIDLVYSDYPAKADLSLLTKKRLETLHKVLPSVFLDTRVGFRKVRQTIGTTKATAAGLQHGFFIYFRPLPTKTSGKEEARKLEALVGKKPRGAGSGESAGRPGGVDSLGGDGGEGSLAGDKGGPCYLETLLMEDTVGFRMDSLPEHYVRTIRKISAKDAISSGQITKDSVKSWGWGDSVYCVKEESDGGCETDGYSIYELPDSTVTQVFKRHSWAHSFIVADVTGSMYPYTAQLLKWLQLNLTDKEDRYFIFFNDGDNKDDDKKVIGKTGGIYPVVTNQYDEVERTITRAMTNGSGGDAPENNIEALLESEKVCGRCDSIVMVVDNWAPIKDISLLSRYHKPVKVVVCGVFDRINTDYLKLARDTKGSIHLIEEDIYTLSELKEGETIRIHGVTYKLVGGNFVDVTPRRI